MLAHKIRCAVAIFFAGNVLALPFADTGTDTGTSTADISSLKDLADVPGDFPQAPGPVSPWDPSKNPLRDPNLGDLGNGDDIDPSACLACPPTARDKERAEASFDKHQFSKRGDQSCIPFFNNIFCYRVPPPRVPSPPPPSPPSPNSPPPASDPSQDPSRVEPTGQFRRFNVFVNTVGGYFNIREDPFTVSGGPRADIGGITLEFYLTRYIGHNAEAVIHIDDIPGTHFRWTSRAMTLNRGYSVDIPSETVNAAFLYQQNNVIRIYIRYDIDQEQK